MRRAVHFVLLGFLTACSSSSRGAGEPDAAPEPSETSADGAVEGAAPDAGSDDAADDTADVAAEDAADAVPDASPVDDAGDDSGDAAIDDGGDATIVDDGGDATIVDDAGDATIVDDAGDATDGSIAPIVDDSLSSLWFGGGWYGAVDRYDFASSAVTRLHAHVSGFDLAANGSVIGFTWDPFISGRTDLWTMNADGTGAHELVAMSGLGKVGKVCVSPNGARVAYFADTDASGHLDVWLASTAGGAPVKVSPARASVYDSTLALQPDSMQWSADSRWLAIVGAFSAVGVHRIWLVDASAATPAPQAVLAATDVGMPPYNAWVGVDPQLPAVFASGGRLVFRGRMQIDAKPFLYTVGLDGLGLAKLDGPSPTANLGTFGVSRDGATVAFASDAMLANAYEVYAMPSAGGTPARVTSGFVAAGQGPIATKPLTFSPDGANIAFVANIGTGTRREPFVVPSTPGGLTRRLAEAPNQGVAALAWSPSGTQLAVLGDLETSGNQDIFELSIAQTDQKPTKLVPAGASNDVRWTLPASSMPFPADAGFDVGYTDASATDGAIAGTSHLWFTSDWKYPGNDLLERIDYPYAPSLTPPTATSMLNDVIDVGPIAVAADGARVAFVGEVAGPYEYDLWILRADGTGLTKLAPGPDLSAFSDLQLSPDGASVGYVSGGAVWVVPSSGASAPRRVSPAPLTNVYTSPRYAFSPDSKTVAILGAYADPKVTQLYFTDLAVDPPAPEAPIPLSAWKTTYGSGGPNTIGARTPAWTGADEVVFAATDATAATGLFRASRTGTAPIKVLGVTNAPNEFRLSPDAKTLAFVDTSTGLLQAIPIAGGTSVRLYSTGGIYDRFAWKPDGSALALIATSSGSYGSTYFVVVPASATDFPPATVLASFSSSWSVSAPVWAPDGSTFAFTSTASSKTELYQFDTATKTFQSPRLVHTSANASLYLRGLAWTP